MPSLERIPAPGVAVSYWPSPRAPQGPAGAPRTLTLHQVLAAAGPAPRLTFQPGQQQSGAYRAQQRRKMANQHTKRAARMAAAEAMIANRPGAKKKPARPRVRTNGTRHMEAAVSSLGIEERIAGDLAAVFERHGVKVHGIAIAPAPADGCDMLCASPGAAAGQVAPQLTPARELPAELARAEMTMDILAATLGDLTRRLDEGGLLAPEPADGDAKAEAMPNTSVGQRLRVLGNRIGAVDGGIRALMRRLEA